MYKRHPPEHFSMRCRDGERFVAIAISPDLVISPAGTSTNPSEERSSLLTYGTTTTMDDMTKTLEAVRGAHAFPNLVVVAETVFPYDSFRSDILYLQPCFGEFMVPRLIGTSAVRITNVLWENVTWVGLSMTKREVSCLITVTEHDVCLSEISERGDMLDVCRVKFKFPITDCIFQSWVPRIIYTSLNGAGIIDFNFEFGIKPTKHIFHAIFEDKSVIDTPAGNQGYLTTPRSKAPSLTCVSLTPMRNEVLVGDNKGAIFTFGGIRGTFTRQRQLTFPFPLATLAVAGGQGPFLFLAGVATTPNTSVTPTETGITKVTIAPTSTTPAAPTQKTLSASRSTSKVTSTPTNSTKSKSTTKEPATSKLTILTSMLTSMKSTSTSSTTITSESTSITSPSTTRSLKSPTLATSTSLTRPQEAISPPLSTTTTTSDPGKPRPSVVAPITPGNKELHDFPHGRAPNAGILKVDLSLASPPVFQEVGEGHVLRMTWYRHPRHPLLTTIDSKLGLVHHQVMEDVHKNLSKEFAVKPLDRPGGRAVWGSGGWLAYITEVEAVLEREPAILATPDD